LALAASVCFGMLSVFTKVVGHQFQHDKVAAMLHPHVYMLAIFAITGLLTSQTAFRIAPLSVSLPLIDVGEPFVASMARRRCLHETLDLGSGTAVGVALSGAAVALGVGLLDTLTAGAGGQAEGHRARFSAARITPVSIKQWRSRRARSRSPGDGRLWRVGPHDLEVGVSCTTRKSLARNESTSIVKPAILA